MSDELNARAARAMGWESEYIDGACCWTKDGAWVRSKKWSPTTDANACRELLQEVELRGLIDDFTRIVRVFFRNQHKDWNYEFYLMTAPLPVIVAAAVEVLEAE